MKTAPPRVVYAEKVSGDLHVIFQDGKEGLFPAALLRSVLSKARKPPKDPNDP